MSLDKPKCKKCGETEWLIQKTEKKFYYAVVNLKELRWIEQTKLKIISPFNIICSKCEGSAEDLALRTYIIRNKPLKVIWQSETFENFFDEKDHETENKN